MGNHEAATSQRSRLILVTSFASQTAYLQFQYIQALQSLGIHKFLYYLCRYPLYIEAASLAAVFELSSRVPCSCPFQIYQQQTPLRSANAIRTLTSTSSPCNFIVVFPKIAPGAKSDRDFFFVAFRLCTFNGCPTVSTLWLSYYRSRSNFGTSKDYLRTSCDHLLSLQCFRISAV
jgi:hypothetical protein